MNADLLKELDELVLSRKRLVNKNSTLWANLLDSRVQPNYEYKKARLEENEERIKWVDKRLGEIKAIEDAEKISVYDTASVLLMQGPKTGAPL